MICCPWRPRQPKERMRKMKKITKERENWQRVKVKVCQLCSSSLSFLSSLLLLLLSFPPYSYPLCLLLLLPISHCLPSRLGKPSFMIMEPTEEQRQLAEQARSYGKQMVALQSGEGGEGGPPTPVQDEEPAQSVRNGKQNTISKATCLVMSPHSVRSKYELVCIFMALLTQTQHAKA